MTLDKQLIRPALGIKQYVARFLVYKFYVVQFGPLRRVPIASKHCPADVTLLAATSVHYSSLLKYVAALTSSVHCSHLILPIAL